MYRYNAMCLPRSWDLPGYCNVNIEHMISVQRSLTLRDSYLFDVLQLKCPAQEGSAHPLVACSIFRSSMGGREDFSAIFTVTFSSRWPGAHGKNWRRQTMNNRVQGWAVVPAQHVPLRDVDYRGLGGHSKDQGTSSAPLMHTWDTCSVSLCYLKTQHAITHSTPERQYPQQLFEVR